MSNNKIIQDLQATKDQLGPSDVENFVFKLLSDNQVRICQAEMVVNSTNLGNAFTVGHPQNGIVGTALGINGLQVVVGSQALGSTTQRRFERNIDCAFGNVSQTFLMQNDTNFITQDDKNLLTEGL